MIKKNSTQLDFDKKIVPCRKLHQNHDWKTMWTLSGTYGGDHVIGYTMARLRCKKCGKSKIEKSTRRLMSICKPWSWTMEVKKEIDPDLKIRLYDFQERLIQDWLNTGEHGVIRWSPIRK